MQVILLSGGSGKRLWPLSNDVRSKQFIKIFKQSDGSYESMLQRVYRQLKNVDKDVKVTIATSDTQLSAIYNQLGKDVNVSIEPCRRDTFPAIALATAYLHDVLGVRKDESVVVCPVDPYVEQDYFKALKDLSDLADKGTANLTLMGIEPTYPSEKYGYIIPTSKDFVSRVLTFKEKPSESVAKEYIKQGALWNGGVFAYKVEYLLNIAHQLISFSDYHDLYNKYSELNKISFDYAVVEHEENINVMRFEGMWKDLGTWNTLIEVMSDPIMGKVITDTECKNINVINELDVPVLCMGLENTIIAASAEGIIVSEKDRSSHIKPYVDSISQEIMFAEKSWGSYRVLDVQKGSLTIKAELRTNNAMNYHSHNRRDEVWTIVSGQGKVIIDDEERIVNCGDVISLPRGSKHTIMAISDLTIIEVQIGTDISVEDKILY
ncbi:MAG: sugar phosphate nucleotidyltransferase [Candidatus Onthomorpha sp.]|nr:sugar phosphate nucleotidyltransferase [Bacteroidales bacterium]MDY5699341.1 sugar phosphate nucleotidyltransferase [Candidatus Onthomorpha sp.]